MVSSGTDPREPGEPELDDVLQTLIRLIDTHRSAFAYEADVLNSNLIPSFPKRAGIAAEALVGALFGSAAGGVRSAFAIGSRAGAEHQTSRLQSALAAAQVEVEDLRHGAQIAADEIAGFLALKTFPRGRRPETEKQVSRLRGIARGEVDAAYAAVPNQRLRRAMRIAEAETVYSVGRWLKECESRGAVPRM
jgi:hypothetical protein